ncbi:hypothetical protein KOI35_37455 [Actinoplanes bogorensis]|uniref:Alpha/beta hydrolase n=1 Tax=Paractinoplanes bogorensis TaxID=1610840 RepID=A0ABS5Z2P0_9ACTN|nr:hypothetical protein [Actinoplanes bogorensis]MBU2669214.1 hypothetical protein [Actinoplanes bogorensis]
MAAVLAVVAGVTAYGKIESQRPVSLTPSGPHAVGRLTDEWVDRSRTDQFAPIGGTPRILSTWILYPAAPGAPGPESVYTPGKWAGLHRFGWGMTAFDRVRTGTRDGVPPAPGPFPVVVLLPDLGYAAPQYSAIASALAARGNVVVGVTPTYSARLTVINDQRVAASAAGSGPDRQDQLVSVWAADARFAARRAVQQFGRSADAGRIAYAGHGLGGSATIEACRVDGRCDAAIALDGEPRGLAGFGRPLLRLSTAGTDYAAYRIVAPLRWTLPSGSLKGRRGLDITVEYTASFLHDTFAGVSWTAPPYPEARHADILSR